MATMTHDTKVVATRRGQTGLAFAVLAAASFGLSGSLVLGFLASAGYAASLPLQERLLTHTTAAVRGQVLGLYSTGMMAMQGIAAVLAGLLAQRLGGGTAGAATAIGVLGCVSLTVTVSLIPGLRRTRPAPDADREPVTAGG